MTFQTTDLEDLTPGAVFVREDGSKRFVLFVANATLTGKKAERFPIRVVFANESSQVFDIDVKSFFVGCKFYNIEPDLEQRLDSLFVYKDSNDITLDEAVINAQKLNEEEENKEIISFEDEDIVSEDGLILSDLVKEEDFLIPEVTYPISFINDNVDAKPQVVPELLAALLINYAQEPQLSTGYMWHKLTFTVPANISTAAIKSCFDVGTIRSDAIYSIFELNSDDFGSDARRIDWSHSIGAYPEYFNGKIALQIVLAEPYESVEDVNTDSVKEDIEQSDVTPEVQLVANYSADCVTPLETENNAHLNAMQDLTYLPTNSIEQVQENIHKLEEALAVVAPTVIDHDINGQPITTSN